MSVKSALKDSPLTKGVYSDLRDKKRNWIKRRRIHSKYQFINRSKKQSIVCIVLAGYKEYLYPYVMPRIKRFAPDYIDICIVSAGKFSHQLAALCAANEWSYLSTKEKNIGLAQNTAIALHGSAEYVFKIDEDIFVTEGFFDNLLHAYEHSRTTGYTAGVVAPIMPLNGYGHYRILERLGLLELYGNKFQHPTYGAGRNQLVETSPSVARFFWGEGGFIPHIDDLNKTFSQGEIEERPCAIKFSIGAILFNRKLWEEMGYFEVRSRREVGLGQDEKQLCLFCCSQSRPILVSENVVVGHFSFGPQNEEMKRYLALNDAPFSLC